MPGENLSSLEDSPYFKKMVTLRVNHTQLELAVGHDLFSSHAVDAGSRLLLRTLVDTPPPSTILDVGCGYGPLGLCLKARFPAAHLDMVDRDALAVQFAAFNAERNSMQDVTAFGSLGYDAIDADHGFELVVSNLPGKAGPPVIEELLVGAGRMLRPDGMGAVVVVAALSDEVAGMLTRNEAELLLQHEGREFTVFHFTIEPQQGDTKRGFERQVYRRHEGRFALGPLEWRATTAWGLPEFDSLSYHTELALKTIVDARLTAERLLVVEPGQGHLPVGLARSCAPEAISLAGRDLLSLRMSQQNLAGNGFHGAVQQLHCADLSRVRGRFDLVVASLKGKLPMAVHLANLEGCAGRVAEHGTLVVAGRSATLTRLLDSAVLNGFTLESRVRKHGFSVIRLGRLVPAE